MVRFADWPDDEKRRVYQSADPDLRIPAWVPSPRTVGEKQSRLRSWRLGWWAADQGMPRRACPFARSTVRHLCWQQGFSARLGLRATEPPIGRVKTCRSARPPTAD